MQHAAHLPRLPSTRTMLAPVVALVVGAGAATGAYALIDDADQAVVSPEVIVVEAPAPGSSQIAGKDEAATAAAITPGSAQIAGKDEAGTAAAISSGEFELRGSKASASGTTTLSEEAETSRRTDPHGPASSLPGR